MNMGVLLEIILLIAGFVLLIKGADVFVDASVGIAKRLKIPNVVIGLTIVAMGTSMPEMVVSISAAINGSNAMAVGNAIGSNIFNLLPILGFCALIMPVPIRLKEIARDYWISVGAAGLLLIMVIVFRNRIPRMGSFAFFAAFIVYMVILVRQALKNRDTEEETAESVGNPKSLLRSVCLAVLGAGLIVGGGQLTVTNAVSIAIALGITERVVGLTIVAIGTSLPEFVTSLVACKKGENAIAIGNVIGSNIFNIMLVLGISGIIRPLTIDGNLIIDIAVLIIGSFAVLPLAFRSKRVVRLEGLLMVLMYAAYMGFIIIW